jgi:polysaccharide export outer membrane protein
MRLRFCFSSELMLATALALLSCAVSADLEAQSLPNNGDAKGTSTIHSATQPTGPAVPDLVIGHGDLLEVKMFGSADFRQEVRVSSAGDISLPLIGAVHVAGLTPVSAQEVIQEKLIHGHFYKNPQLSVFVKDYGSGGVYVLGEVQKPGFYPLVNIQTILEAISVAGGITPRAGNVVSVTNPNRPQPAITIALSHEPQRPMQENLQLMPGDTIEVAKAGIVYVVGDVRLPSGIVMEHGDLTVLQAIAMAQGTNPSASLNHAKLIRRSGDKPQELSLALKKILAARAPDVKLQPEDIVFVPSSASKGIAKRSAETALQLATGLAIYGRW